MGLTAFFQRARTNQLLADQLSVMQGGMTSKQAFQMKQNGPESARYRRTLPRHLALWRRNSAKHPEPEYTQHLRQTLARAEPWSAWAEALRQVIAEREAAQRNGAC
jgi:hypothetical protein